MSKEHICIIAADGLSLLNFRGKLIQEWTKRGCRVTCISIEPYAVMASKVQALGAEYYSVPGSRTDTGIFDGLRMIHRYKKALKQIKPDICFLFMGKPVAFGGIAAISAKISRIVVLVNGLEMAFYSPGLKNVLLRNLLKILFGYVHRHAETVFFMCREDMKKMLKWHIVKKEQTAYVDGSGVDMTHFVKTELPKEPVVCMAARLVWSKGVREFADAARIVRETRPDLGVRFIYVGGMDTNAESLTKRELEALIAQNEFEYRGYHDDVLPFLQECSIFVLPSYHEGKGRAILEAQAVGRPIITTTAPGCSETVIEGYNGYKVPAKSAQALADKIIFLAENPQIRAEMAENAYEHCKKTFDVNIINKVFLERMKID